MRFPLLVGLLTVLASQPAAAPAPPLVACLDSGRPVARWGLPALFREVSGLALTADGRLLLHNDERAVIGVVDTASGRVVATWQLGATPPPGDFEDIAVVGDTVVLTTSAGVLLQAALPRPGTASGMLEFVTVETGIGARCEIEGLAFDPRERTLLFGCKTPRVAELGRNPTIFRWSFDRRAMATPDRMVVPLKDLEGRRPLKEFRTSAMARDPRSGELFLVSSADEAMVVTDPSGKVLGAGAIPRRHRQPEGLAIARNGTVYLSDEGAKAPGTITIYSCR